jgi:uncharacterized membrane protein YjjP (DUF1212 family)
VPRKYRLLFSRIAVEDGFERLQQITELKPLYSNRLQWVLMALASAGCCGLFFNGSWSDIAMSLVLGCVVALLGEFNTNFQFSRVYEVSNRSMT